MADRGGRIILEGSERTAFEYRIDGGMDERDRDEIECMDSGYVVGANWPRIVSDSVDLHHRMNYIRRRNLGFSYLGISDKSFEQSLASLHAELPKILGEMVSDFYRNGTQRVSDLVENVSRKNPSGFKDILENRQYEHIIRSFLETLTDCSENVGNLLNDCFFDRVPADRYGCASIDSNRINGYRTKLILQIVLKA